MALGYLLVVPELNNAGGLPWNQGSNYALVRALSDGTAKVDRYRWQSGDLSYFEGHYYSVRAPGLAIAEVPVYKALSLAGVAPQGTGSGPDRAAGALGMIWALGLFGTVLPAVILVGLVARTAERLRPGSGAPTGLTLGLATLVRPFASMLFVHALSTLLGFAAFALLLRARQERAPAAALLVGGLAAGLAITAEYPLAILALVLAGYAVSKRPAVRRGALFLSGVGLGVTPLVLYNWWAFGSPRHLSYVDAIAVQGSSGHDQLGLNTAGLFGIRRPSPHVALELLFANRGLFTLAPILLLSAIGILWFFRRGYRAEALTIAAAALAYLIYVAGYETPFGGDVPGPRLLLPAVPFLALAVAPCFDRLAGMSWGLVGVSATMMAVAVGGHPLLHGDDTGVWAHNLRRGDLQPTVLTWLGAGHGWVAFSPALFAGAIAVICVARPVSTRGFPVSQLPSGLAALACWAAGAVVCPILVTSGHPRYWGGAWSIACATLVGGVLLIVLARPRRAGALP